MNICPYCARNNEIRNYNSYWFNSTELYSCSYCERTWFAAKHEEVVEKIKKPLKERIMDWLKDGKR